MFDKQAYYHAQIFFPLSWEMTDVENWIAEKCAPLWHYSLGLEPTGQFYAWVKYQPNY